jgi:transaldolase
MSVKSVLEKLQEANPAAEIWWDSSPLVYASWARGVVDKAPAEKKEVWREQLKRLFDPENPGTTEFRGVTTNPPLSLAAVKDNPKFWGEFVRTLIQENPNQGVEEIFWMMYRKVVELGAKYFKPLWDKSNHKMGYLSGQVDPRDLFNADRMLAQGLDLAPIAPNVMIKVPGTKQGYEVIEELTARGIATNNTLSFTVPQFVACMEAVRRGLERAKKNGVDLFRWRSVITHMSARYGNLGDLKAQADSRGIALSDWDIKLGELALFKRAYKIIQEKGYQNKMLMCSMRVNPPVDGKPASSWHIEKIAGSDVVYTCPPGYIAELMAVEDHLQPFNPEAIHEEAPKEVMDKLMQVPYFVHAYEVDGMTPDQFSRQGALVATAAEFQKATRTTIDFVAQQFQAVGRKI